MRRCPLTYEPLGGQVRGAYSEAGLRRLSRRLEGLEDLPFSAQELRREAMARAAKMSIQGVQPKLSARLAVGKGRFELIDRGGVFILKPQNGAYPNLPENEDLTMRLADLVGIETPQHGLVYARDGSLVYFVRRFDRFSRKGKLAVEDFAQLGGRTRATKYEASLEQVVAIIDRFATFPMVERLELFRRTIFCWLTGNEDMHLKNFSLITREGKVTLTPAYDLVNTSIVLDEPREEMALPLRGKRVRLRREDLLDYFGRERLGLPEAALDAALERLSAGASGWEELIERSFLPDSLRRDYLALVGERRSRLGL